MTMSVQAVLDISSSFCSMGILLYNQRLKMASGLEDGSGLLVTSYWKALKRVLATFCFVVRDVFGLLLRQHLEGTAGVLLLWPARI